MKKLALILSLALCASLPAQARINATFAEWTQQYGYGNPTGVGEELSIPPNQTLTTKEFQLNVIDFFKALPFPTTLSLTAGQTPIGKAGREALAKNGLEIPENHAFAVLSGGNRLIIQAHSAEVAFFQRMVEAFNKKSPMPLAIAPPKLGEIYIFKRGEYVVRATFIGDKAQEVEFVRVDGKPFEMNELPGLMRPLSPAIQEAQISPAADVTYGNKDESVCVHREKTLLRVSAIGFDRKDRLRAAGQQSAQEVKKGKPGSEVVTPPNPPKPATPPNGILSEQGIVNINPDFVAEVLTGLTRDNRFYRYNQPVKVSLHSEGAKYHASLAAKITEINSVLNGCTTTLELLADNVMDADLSIYVAHQPELQIVRRKFGGIWFFNDDKTKKKTIQLLPIESLNSPEQAWREKRIGTELIEALGFKFSGESRLMLTPLDKMIIRFGYQFVPSGSDRNEIRALVRRYWDQTKVPTP